MRPSKDIGPPATSVRFGPFHFNTLTGELYRHDRRLKLSGHAIEILGMLVTRPGELVTREELERELWPGGGFGDFEHGLNAAVNRLRENLLDSAIEPRYIETVPRRGYRFIAPLEDAKSEPVEDFVPQATGPPGQPIASEVSPCRMGGGDLIPCETLTACDHAPGNDEISTQQQTQGEEDGAAQDSHPQSNEIPPSSVRSVAAREEPAAPRWVPYQIIAIAVILILVGIGIWRLIHTPKNTDPSHRVIAVLFINDFTRDPTIGWLSTSIADLLTTNLAQVKGIQVLSRDRVMLTLNRARWSNQAPEIAEAQEIARDLGADAYITGTLLKSATQIRLEVRAQDAKTGRIIFSEKEDLENSEAVFGMIDELTRSLAASFLPNETALNSPHVEHASTSSIEAYRHYQLGMDYAHRYLDEEAVQEFERAIIIDPRFASAYLELGFLYSRRREFKSADAYLEKIDQFHLHLPKREQLVLAVVRAYRGTDPNGAEIALQQLLNQFPHENMERGILAGILANGGQSDRAIELIRAGLDLNEHDDVLLNFESYILMTRGDTAGSLAANEAYQKIRPADPNPPQSRGDLLFAVGRDDEAIASYKQSIAIRPDFEDFSTFATLALVYADQRKFSQANAVLETFSKKTSAARRTAVPTFRAQIQIEAGDPVGALASYRSAVLQLQQAHEYEHAGEILTNYAKLAVDLGRTAEALEFVKQRHLGGEEQFELSALEMLSGNSNAAREDLETLSSIAPWTAPPIRVKAALAWSSAWASVERGDGRTALENIAIVNHDRKCMYLRARAHLLNNEYADAEADFLHTIRLQRLLGGMWVAAERFPLEEILSLYYLGQLYDKTGRRAEATRAYSDFLSHFPAKSSPFRQVSEARAALNRIQ